MPTFITTTRLCAISLWALANGPVTAQSFHDLETKLAQHPSLVALTLQADASRNNSIAASALPDPVISLGINNFPIFNPSFSRFLPTHKAIGVRQNLPSHASRNAQASQDLASAKLSDLTRTAQYQTLRGELIALLHHLERVKQQRKLVQMRARKYDELTRVVESEINAGRSVVFRLAEIESERANVNRSMVDLDQQKANINAKLIDLVGLVPPTPAPNVSPATWSGNAQDFHAVRVAYANVQIAKRSVDAAKAAWQPNLGLNLTWQQRQAGDTFAGDDWVSGTVTFSVPLWANSSQKPRLLAAKANLASAELLYQATARRSAALYAAYDAARTAAKNTIAVHKQNIAAVKDRIAAQTTTYQSGVGDYTPVVDGHIAVLKLRADIHQQQARLTAAIARMNALLVTS